LEFGRSKIVENLQFKMNNPIQVLWWTRKHSFPFRIIAIKEVYQLDLPSKITCHSTVRSTFN
jgi:hypothetical protein